MGQSVYGTRHCPVSDELVEAYVTSGKADRLSARPTGGRFGRGRLGREKSCNGCDQGAIRLICILARAGVHGGLGKEE